MKNLVIKLFMNFWVFKLMVILVIFVLVNNELIGILIMVKRE